LEESQLQSNFDFRTSPYRTNFTTSDILQRNSRNYETPLAYSRTPLNSSIRKTPLFEEEPENSSKVRELMKEAQSKDDRILFLEHQLQKKVEKVEEVTNNSLQMIQDLQRQQGRDVI